MVDNAERVKRFCEITRSIKIKKKRKEEKNFVGSKNNRKSSGLRAKLFDAGDSRPLES